MTCLISPCAERKVHPLPESFCSSGAAGRVLASAAPGNNPTVTGDNANAMDTPAAAALRMATFTPCDCLRANLKNFRRLRFMDAPPGENCGLRFYSRNAGDGLRLGENILNSS